MANVDIRVAERQVCFQLENKNWERFNFWLNNYYFWVYNFKTNR